MFRHCCLATMLLLPLLLLPLVLLLAFVHAHEGITTPPMGWNTWNKYGCHIYEQLIKDTADIMVTHGYRDAGYTYLNLDDCWQSNERTADGYIVIDQQAFPNGIRQVADYVHDKGLKFGVYSSAGRQTCAGRMASSGYEIQDAQTYAGMGVDYLKYDNCNYEEGISAKTRYEAMAKAINATGRHIFISVCNWGTENTWEWASQYGHSFRTHDDIYNDWKSIVEILNVHATVVGNSGPGRWADPDMLEIGNDRLTVDESKTHFSIWAAMKSPLILGSNLSTMSKKLYDIVTNRNIIAVNQDPLGIPARRIVHIPHQQDIWVGELVNQTMVMVIINYLNQYQTFNININDFGYEGSNVNVMDLWENRTVMLVDKRHINNIFIPAHGVAMFKLLNGSISVSNDSSLDNSSTEVRSYQKARRYEAEDLNNMVYGLARRRGCLTCSNGAQVIALGKVNHPQTGTLQFRDVQIDKAGTYRLTLGYLDCFSWMACGDYWTRRWEVGITVNNSDTDNRHRRVIALKSHRQVEKTGRFSLGLILKDKGVLDITLDNPHDFGPSIDYIELEWMNDFTDRHHLQNNAYTFLFPFWQSDDPLVSEGAWLIRYVVDYFWEWMSVVMLTVLLGVGVRYVYKKFITHRQNRYTVIASSNSSVINAEE